MIYDLLAKNCSYVTLMELHEISSQYWSHFVNEKSQNQYKDIVLSFIDCWIFKMFSIACSDAHATKSPRCR